MISYNSPDDMREDGLVVIDNMDPSLVGIDQEDNRQDGIPLVVEDTAYIEQDLSAWEDCVA